MREKRFARGNRVGVVLRVLIGLVIPLVASASAAAATEPFGPKLCLSGSGAGQCDFARGVATSPVTGHFFVADRRNERINEFSAWGEFVKSWGWGVRDGSVELQTCTAQTGCRQGLEGAGGGEFEAVTAVAVDSAGNIYAADPSAHRIQKFNPEGEFLLMFGGGVDQGPHHPGNVCTAAFIAEGDVCGSGASGNGNGEFSASWPFFSNMAIGPDDEIYVGDKGRIQEFDTGGNFVRVLPDPDQLLRNGTPAEDKSVGSLAVDPLSGDLYLSYPNSSFQLERSRPNVFRLDEETGARLDTLEATRPGALATDSSGDVYVFDQLVNFGTDPANHGTRIFKFDVDGNLLETFAEGPPTEVQRESVGLATGSFCFGPGQDGLYVAMRDEIKEPHDWVQAYGPRPDPALCPPPDFAPDIDEEFVSAVDTDSATVLAEINPHYFTPPVGETTYYVQWGNAECIEDEGFEGGCATAQPAPPGAPLDSPPVNEDVGTEPIVLGGLSPETTYRYRFIAEREREESADPPVWVVIGEGGDFTTFPEPSAQLPCPNDAFRQGAGAQLPDCRAYELVSPFDKGGGDVQPRLNIPAFEARMDEASLSGEELTFSAYRAFQNPASAPFSSQYLSRRSAGGWGTEAISPPQEGEAFVNPLIPIDNLYRAFSPDLSQAWLMTDTEPVLGPGGLAGHPNIYRRDNQSDTYAACTTALPQKEEKGTQAPQLQGFSADGNLAVFRVQNKLTDNASDETPPGSDTPIYQLYACSFEGGSVAVHLVSVLPSGVASSLENTAGGPGNLKFNFHQGRTESLEHAVVADGSKVFWTASSSADASLPGALYLRLNPAAAETPSSECEESEPQAACTVLISAGPARFWTAADDGSVAIFSEGGDLNEYEVATAETRSIAEEVVGVLGASEDVGRIYFLSEAEIGEEGQAGEPNLYLYDKVAEATTFIATLSQLDGTQAGRLPSPGSAAPGLHTARVTPDGSVVAFMSNDADLAEEVAGYDNTDQSGGGPAAEIYRYAAGKGLACISCNRGGQRPRGRQIQNKFLSANTSLYAASMLPTWLNALYAPRVLSSDGDRIFFEAFEPLVLADTNGKADVYQWEALDKGSCEEADSTFDPQSQGCLSLLSSGKSTSDSQFVDASPSGDDVFIRTASPLLAWDPGAIDIYDARIEGGLPAPPLPPDPEEECDGEACQPPATAPSPAPSPQTIGPSSGNVREAAKPKRCRKGTHRVRRKGKVVCVKNKKGKNRAGESRRAGR
jgi:hypothetical protein